MKKEVSTPYAIQSISDLHRLFALPAPDHPLISVMDFSLLSYAHSDIWHHFTNDFYCIAIKKGANAHFKYGLRDFDFNEGMMTFTQPGQVFGITAVNDNPVTGYILVFKPDLIRSYPLGKEINNYGFFSYSLAEALHLSEKEAGVITSLLQQMQQELKSNIDQYSQDVIVAHVGLLLNYANRFYNRQFLTRKTVNHDLLVRLEQLLSDHFNDRHPSALALPTVQYLAQQLNMSASYLSDMLRNLTGLNAQQYIHRHLIDKAKELLAGTRLSVSEIAYQLGFEYPQSFSKLFRKSTDQTPVQYRQSFH